MRQCSLRKGTENEGNNYTQLPKLSSLADSEAGCENLTSKVSVQSPLPRQNNEKLQCLNFTWVDFEAREFSPVKTKRARKIEFRYHKIKWIISTNDILQAEAENPARFTCQETVSKAVASALIFTTVSHLLPSSPSEDSHPVHCTPLSLTCTAQENTDARHGFCMCRSYWRTAQFLQGVKLLGLKQAPAPNSHGQGI